MSIRLFNKFLLLTIMLVISIIICGCSCCAKKPRIESHPSRPSATITSRPSLIFDYPNTAALYRQPYITSSEQFIRPAWPLTSLPTGYVSYGESAGYREYTTDHQRINSDNTPRQYYRQRTHTFRSEFKAR